MIFGGACVHGWLHLVRAHIRWQEGAHRALCADPNRSISSRMRRVCTHFTRAGPCRTRRCTPHRRRRAPSPRPPGRTRLPPPPHPRRRAARTHTHAPVHRNEEVRLRNARKTNSNKPSTRTRRTHECARICERTHWRLVRHTRELKHTDSHRHTHRCSHAHRTLARTPECTHELTITNTPVLASLMTDAVRPAALLPLPEV